MAYTLAWKKQKQIEKLFKEHIQYGVTLSGSGNSSQDGNYLFFSRNVDPRTTTPQSQDKFCMTLEDGSSKYFLYENTNRWALFENGSHSPYIESNKTTLWPWESGITWNAFNMGGVSGSITPSTVFEFKQVRWTGIVEYNPTEYPETKYGKIYSNSNGTMDNQETLEEGREWARYLNNNKRYLIIQKDDDGYRWYYKGKSGDTTINRTYHAKATIEELGWPWDNYDWYQVKRSRLLEDISTYDFRNMDNIEKVNKGPYNWSINVTTSSHTYTLICNNNDPDGTVMPYCKFVGNGLDGKLYALYLAYGGNDNTFRWVWQPYGSFIHQESYSNQTSAVSESDSNQTSAVSESDSNQTSTVSESDSNQTSAVSESYSQAFTMGNILWPWDTNIVWTGTDLHITKN